MSRLLRVLPIAGAVAFAATTCTPDLELERCYPDDPCADGGGGAVAGGAGGGGLDLFGDGGMSRSGGQGGGGDGGGGDGGASSMGGGGSTNADDIEVICCGRAACVADCATLCEPGNGGEPGESRYFVVRITDASPNFASVDEDLAPGTDVCGVVARCGNETVRPVEAVLDPGRGNPCTGPGQPRAECTADRTNPDAALDDGGTCSDQMVPSDFVSLGVTGTLAVRFETPIDGCRVTIAEWAARGESDAFNAFSCEDLGGGTCVKEVDEFDTGDGNVEFVAPEPRPAEDPCDLQRGSCEAECEREHCVLPGVCLGCGAVECP